MKRFCHTETLDKTCNNYFSRWPAYICERKYTNGYTSISLYCQQVSPVLITLCVLMERWSPVFNVLSQSRLTSGMRAFLVWIKVLFGTWAMEVNQGPDAGTLDPPPMLSYQAYIFRDIFSTQQILWMCLIAVEHAVVGRAEN